jgi:ubiquinone/menaquinone biosynthesis C-methylase UbiE
MSTGDVLEVAIGTGRNLPFCPRDAAVTGVELSPALLAIARTRAAEFGREVELRDQADAEALPFAAARFDTVVCTLSLYTIPDYATTLAEMARCCGRAAGCCCSTTSTAAGGRSGPSSG